MGGSRGCWANVALAAIVATSVVATAQAARAGTITYSYDARGRVTSATYANGLTTAYVYDAAGNRTQVTTAAPPVANPVALGVAVNTTSNPVPLSVSGGYSSVAVAAGPGHGSASAAGTSITYSPTGGYTGPDSFTYKATNGSGTSPPATVLVAVAPAAQNLNPSVAYNSSNNSIPTVVVGAYASIALFSLPGHGVAAPSGSSIIYTPTAGYTGGDSFQYTASNAVATSSPASVAVTVVPPQPIANNFSASVAAYSTNNPMPLNLTGGPATSVAVSTPAGHGSATASGVNINYTPTSGYVGSDSFAYTASNSAGTSNPATGSITVTGLTAAASAPLNCPAGAATYVCITSTTSSYTFTSFPAGVTVSGGSGSYTYLWAISGVQGGTWTTGQTTATITPAVSGVTIENSGEANYTCTVTDTVSGLHATSNAITYSYYRN